MSKANRRSFLKAAVAAVASARPSRAQEGSGIAASESDTEVSGFDIMRRPDFVIARFGSKDAARMQYSALAWTCPGVRVSVEPIWASTGPELPVVVSAEGGKLTYLHIRWKGREREGLLSLGDQWQRSYGDLEWRGTIPERVMPWYFLTFDGIRVKGYGVKTQPAAFCFWQRDNEGVTLSIDLRNGGEAAKLGTRELHACTAVMRTGTKRETIFLASQEFCRVMCPAPRLPGMPLFGMNDWNYAYGKNTAAGILRDADLLTSLAPAGSARPHLVIDDGWQDPSRFPSMPELASQIRARNIRPGLWIRPLRASADVPETWLLPDARFGRNSIRNNLAFDPTHPEALQRALATVHVAVQWGYEFIKHDFTSYELFGRWGFEMQGEVTRPGWHFMTGRVRMPRSHGICIRRSALQRVITQRF